MYIYQNYVLIIFKISIFISLLIIYYCLNLPIVYLFFCVKKNKV